MSFSPETNDWNQDGLNGPSSDWDSTSEFERLLEWARLHASRLRNHFPCVERHRQALRVRGESEQRLSELVHWHQSLALTDREKAALGLSETISRSVSGDSATESVKNAARHFSTDEILRLSMTVMAVNDWIDLQEKPPVRILVVEDNPYDQELFLRQLQKAQMENDVLFLNDGTEAFELIERFRTSSNWGLISIFLDINLPGMSGIELLRRIRTLPGMEIFQSW